MKKVLFIHHGTISGGAPLSLLYTALGIAKYGYKSEVGLLFPSKDLDDLFNSHGITTHNLSFIPFLIVWSGYAPNLFSLRTLKDLIQSTISWGSAQRRLIYFINLHKFDLIHLNSAGLSNSAQILIKNKVPFIWHIREQGPDRHGYRFKFIKNLMSRAKNLIFLSEAERKSWGFNVHGSVIHNFVDLDFFDFRKNIKKIEFKKSFGFLPDDFIILYLGGLKEHKGAEILLKAAGALHRKYTNLKILMPDSVIHRRSSFKQALSIMKRVITLSPNYAEKMIVLINQLGLEANCLRIPFDPDSISFFVASDLVVFPAIQPHFARPIIEASAMKLPVIASDFPVMRELVDDGVTGYLFESKNIKELSKRIEELIKSSVLRVEMGENGFTKAESEFNSIKQTAKVIEVYENALARA